MVNLRINNTRNKEFLIQIGYLSWVVLLTYYIFCFGGFHPSKVMVNFLGLYCKFLILLLNLPSFWKITVELIRHGNIEVELIVKTMAQFLIPYYLL